MPGSLLVIEAVVGLTICWVFPPVIEGVAGVTVIEVNVGFTRNPLQPTSAKVKVEVRIASHDSLCQIAWRRGFLPSALLSVVP
jgi:hypothetical protein